MLQSFNHKSPLKRQTLSKSPVNTGKLITQAKMRYPNHISPKMKQRLIPASHLDSSNLRSVENSLSLLKKKTKSPRPKGLTPASQKNTVSEKRLKGSESQLCKLVDRCELQGIRSFSILKAVKNQIICNK